MKLEEILNRTLDVVSSTKLFEMAYERRKALQHIRSIKGTLAIHTIKIMIFDAPDVLNHWLNEIQGYLTIINKIYIKPKTKKFSGDDYYELLWDEPFGHGVRSINDFRNGILVEDSYKKLPRRNISDALIYERLEKFYHTISFDIANDKEINIINYLNILGI